MPSSNNSNAAPPSPLMIAGVELRTNAKEIDTFDTEIAQLSNILSAISESKTFSGGNFTQMYVIAKAIALGATIAVARLREAGEQMMQGVTDADLAQVVALEGRESER